MMTAGAGGRERGDDLTEVMFQLVLQQQQQLGQMMGQQQQLMQQNQLGRYIPQPEQHQLVATTPPSGAMLPSSKREGDAASIAQLREELNKSRRLMEERVSSLQAERDREVKELLDFKEMASAHLRAQNLTIKRLSHGRGARGARPERSNVRALMERSLGPLGMAKK